MTEGRDNDLETQVLGVAETKRRFSELIDRVNAGERFIVARRGKPVIALVPPSDQVLRAAGEPPIGLAAAAGALAEWEDIDEVVQEIYAARRRSKDRPVPELD